MRVGGLGELTFPVIIKIVLKVNYIFFKKQVKRHNYNGGSSFLILSNNPKFIISVL